MQARIWLALVALVSLSGCGVALQRSGVGRDFSGRFACRANHVTRAGSGYRVEGCGMTAEYVCVSDPDPADFREEHTSEGNAVGRVLGAMLWAGLTAGFDERCHLAYAQQQPLTPMPVASNAPGPVRGINRWPGERIFTTRVLFAGGHLNVRAKPREYPEHVLLVLHSVKRLPEEVCDAKLFHDGVPVEVVEQQRAGAYDVRLLVPLAGLEGAENAVRFAGSVCDLEFELDPSGRSTLGLFAVHMREELVRLSSLTAGAAVSAPVP
jgi:hypothetical protein